MDGIYPEVGLAGRVKVREPFDAIMPYGVIYECVTVETLESLVAKGYSPFDEIYAPNSIPVDQYKLDFASNGKVITFRTTDGDLTRIPSSFVIDLPDPDGIVYTNCAITILIDPIPSDRDIGDVVDDVEQLVASRLGVTANAKQVLYGSDVLLSHDQHRAVESTRGAERTQANSYLVQLQDMTRQRDALKAQLDQAFAFIENLRKEGKV